MDKNLVRELLSLSFEVSNKGIISDDVNKQLSILLGDTSQKDTRFIFNTTTEFHATVIAKILNKNFSKSISTINFLGKEYVCKGIISTNLYIIYFYDNTDRLVLMINAKKIKELLK